MYVHATILKVKPENIPQVQDILSSEQVKNYYLDKGFDHGYLLESSDEPGKLFSLSFWQSQAAAQAAFADPNYAALIAGLRSYLLAAPERISYKLLLTV